MSQRVPMTPEGQKALMEKLKFIRQVERPRIILAIEEARGHGDLSENAEYDAAKEKQQQLDQQMKDIEHKLALAQVIDPATITSDKVVFGATVKILDIETSEEVTYYIVGSDESDVAAKKLSIDSPIARGMIGKEIGDEVRVKTPKGLRVLEIIAIKYGQ